MTAAKFNLTALLIAGILSACGNQVAPDSVSSGPSPIPPTPGSDRELVSNNCGYEAKNFTGLKLEDFIINYEGGPMSLSRREKLEARNFSEVFAFLKASRSHEHAYIPGAYVCADFARALYEEAISQGYAAKYLDIKFENEKIGHALVAIQTLDQGEIFVDFTASKDAYDKSLSWVELGKPYGLLSFKGLDECGEDFQNTSEYFAQRQKLRETIKHDQETTENKQKLAEAERAAHQPILEAKRAERESKVQEMNDLAAIMKGKETREWGELNKQWLAKDKQLATLDVELKVLRDKDTVLYNRVKSAVDTFNNTIPKANRANAFNVMGGENAAPIVKIKRFPDNI